MIAILMAHVVPSNTGGLRQRFQALVQQAVQ